jgi:hypothetical protein
MCLRTEASRPTAVELAQELLETPQLCLARPLRQGQDVADQVALIMGNPRIGHMRVEACPKGKTLCSMIKIKEERIC